MSDTEHQADTYILSWDMYGLESCINASAIDREKVWNTLANKEGRNQNLNQILQYLTMRARFNTQRHYEIYAIEVDNTITEDDLVEQFKQHPQAMADLIRKQGRKIYSDRMDKDKALIT